MNTQPASVPSTIVFMDKAVQFAQFILTHAASDDITAISQHGRYAVANQTVPTEVWAKSIPALGRAAKNGGFNAFVAALRQQDESSIPNGQQLTRFENTVARFVYRHTGNRF